MLLQGDARYIPLADESVQCCMTSPPFWGLRDYGLATWEGGDAECDHKVSGGGPSRLEGASQRGRSDVTMQICPKCGAIRHDAGIGLEQTPEEYVANIVQVFREVKRVLRDDGTLWLNLGDCFSPQSSHPAKPETRAVQSAKRPDFNQLSRHLADERKRPAVTGLKPKNIVGIPWRVAFALQADGADMKAVQTIARVRDGLLDAYDGETVPDRVIAVLEALDEEYRQAKGNSWYLRSDIIWAKPNPMPESVTDRPTKSHEYLFLLAKQPRYYYDAEAVREPNSPTGMPYGAEKSTKVGIDTLRPGGIRQTGLVGRSFERRKELGSHGRNRRDVWTIPTAPFKGAHFAVFPPALVEPCILAGTKQGDIALDPFCGSGTVGQVCQKHGRRFVGMDLSRPYLKLAEERLLKAPVGLL